MQGLLRAGREAIGAREWARRLGYAVPQWQGEVRRALARLKQTLRHERIDGTDWFFPDGPLTGEVDDAVRLLAPFDPIVWDRRRFEAFWGWAYRFEAYTPAPKRIWGYYALPLLWRDDVIGWANLRLAEGRLDADIGYVDSAPRTKAYARALEAEMARFETFLRPSR